MSQELLAEIIFSGLVAVLVLALVAYLLLALYRERRTKNASHEDHGDQREG